MPLHVAFVELTKSFDYVNRGALRCSVRNEGDVGGPGPP